MHHVRALKDIAKSTNAIHRYMIAIARKQIPVCRVHHLELHRGNWSNKPNKKFFVRSNKPNKIPMKPSNVGEPCDG